MDKFEKDMSQTPGKRKARPCSTTTIGEETGSGVDQRRRRYLTPDT
jgi:hypothetical protein